VKNLLVGKYDESIDGRELHPTGAGMGIEKVEVSCDGVKR
jgi:hypothetical protein